MVRTRVISVILLVVCFTFPALAQSPATFTITCSSATACKSGTVPVFTTTGGASKVASSIVSQSGTTVSVAGSVSATTNYEIGGKPFAFGSVTNSNAFLGFAGNSTTTGTGNTGVGPPLSAPTPPASATQPWVHPRSAPAPQPRTAPPSAGLLSPPTQPVRRIKPSAPEHSFLIRPARPTRLSA